MSDLDKAREWAKFNLEKEYFNNKEGADVAAEIIQSLPEKWVDAEKVREVIGKMHMHLQKVGIFDQNWAQGYDDATTDWKRHLEALITPKLPTLAELIEQGHDVDDYLFTWVNTEDGLQLVTMTGDFDDRLIYTTDNRGYRLGKSWEEVVPRPDLPKLEWPGDVVDCEIVDEPETTGSGSIHTPMKSSDVPPNEPWLIEFPGGKAIGTRHAGDSFAPWSVAALDGSHAGDYLDCAVTLIHNLVPEPPALPEGMRLADHEEYGRVVVSPKVDVMGDYKVFPSTSDDISGATQRYVDESELTFLDGVDA